MALLTLTSSVGGATFYLHDLTIVEVNAKGSGSTVLHLNQEDGGVFSKDVDESPAAIVAAADILYSLTLVGGSDVRHINAKRITLLDENASSNAVIVYDRAGASPVFLEADADAATEAAAIGLLI